MCPMRISFPRKERRANELTRPKELFLSFTTAVALPSGITEVELVPGGAEKKVTKVRRAWSDIDQSSVTI